VDTTMYVYQSNSQKYNNITMASAA